MEKVSIIIPTYNREKKIVKAIESVLNQTYKNFELIVVDDGSTDKTKSVVESFKDPRIKYYFQENSGRPAVARNTGIKNCSGSLIAFLDSDDEWLPTKLEKQIKKMKDNKEADVVTCLCIFKNESNNTENKKDFYNYSGKFFDRLFYTLDSMTPSSVLVKKEILDKVGLFDESKMCAGVEDFDLWLRIAKSGYKIDYVPEHLFKYNYHPGIFISKDIDSIKHYKNLEYVYNKYEGIFLNNSKLLYFFGYVFFNPDNKIESLKYLKKSLKIKISFKALSLIILVSTGEIGYKIFKIVQNLRKKLTI